PRTHRDRIRRPHAPPPVLGRPQESAEDGGRVETRQTQPVDAPVPGDERTGAAVAHERVVLDPVRHAVECGTPVPAPWASMTRPSSWSSTGCRRADTGLPSTVSVHSHRKVEQARPPLLPAPFARRVKEVPCL